MHSVSPQLYRLVLVESSQYFSCGLARVIAHRYPFKRLFVLDYTRVSQHQKGKPNLNLLEQEIMPIELHRVFFRTAHSVQLHV